MTTPPAAPALVRETFATPRTRSAQPWAIRAENIGKRFRLGAARSLNDNFAEEVSRSVSRILRLPDTVSKAEEERTFWALRGVSFEIPRGETLGIVGRNGSGKSTLLKILSRIIAPTEGELRYRGRLASLLEVGTGFHRELTGRENIYLNGAILGMSRREIDGRFNTIVQFAEVERFLDTPVKHYSSGMYVRLAFAVAAHLHTDILVVDEVLAVGDAAFQRKCLAKMQEVARGEGRTVLFVSHNMGMVRSLCRSGLWLREGRMAEIGPIETITDDYLRETGHCETVDEIATQIAALPPDPTVELLDFALEQNGRLTNSISNTQPLHVRVRFRIKEPVDGLRVYLDVMDEDQSLLFRSFHDEQEQEIPHLRPGVYEATAEVDTASFAERTYFFRLRCGIYDVRTCFGEGLLVPVSVTNLSGRNLAYAKDVLRSKLLLPANWTLTPTNEG